MERTIAKMQKYRHSLWIVLWALAVCLFLYPINNLPIRLGLVIFTLGAFASSLWFFWNRRPVFCYGLIAVVLVVSGFLICPGRKYDPEKLRDRCLLSLRSYEGTRYIWGGETHFGIDCSGLIRAALIRANFEAGWLTLNPGLVRYSLSLWWHDCSAKALGEEHRGQTNRIISTPGINSLDETQILPGDIAVTANGVHVLAFLGGNEWIEADPDPHIRKVIVVKTPAADNPWFSEPIHVMRWTELEAN